MKLRTGLVIILALLIAAPIVWAAQGSKKDQGAIRVDIIQRKTQQIVGWAILNTTGNGRLIVQAHLHDAAPDQTFELALVFGDPRRYHMVCLGPLETNKQGKANAHGEITYKDFANLLKRWKRVKVGVLYKLKTCYYESAQLAVTW